MRGIRSEAKESLPFKRAPRSAESKEGLEANTSGKLGQDGLTLTLPTADSDLIKRALRGGELQFRNDLGGTASLSVERRGEGRYELTLDGLKIPVQIDAGLPEEEALARITNYASQLPPHMRTGVSEIEVSNKEKANAAATTYGGKKVVFWQGMTYLRPSTFFHEYGHVNAQRVYGHTDPSDAWDQAQSADGRSITDYAQTNDNEDFAEMMEAYWLARRGEGELTLDELRKRFPERMEIVEDVIANRRVETKDSDYWSVFGRNVPKPSTVWRRIDGPELAQKLKGAISRLNPFD